MAVLSVTVLGLRPQSSETMHTRLGQRQPGINHRSSPPK